MTKPLLDALLPGFEVARQAQRQVSLVHLAHAVQFYQNPSAEFNRDFATTPAFMAKPELATSLRLKGCIDQRLSMSK